MKNQAESLRDCSSLPAAIVFERSDVGAISRSLDQVHTSLRLDRSDDVSVLSDHVAIVFAAESHEVWARLLGRLPSRGRTLDTSIVLGRRRCQQGFHPPCLWIYYSAIGDGSYLLGTTKNKDGLVINGGHEDGMSGQDFG